MRLISLLLAATLIFSTVLPAADGGWIDLTHPFDSSTIYWPTATPFTREVVHKGPTPGGYWYESNDIRASEHGGTHLDAPVHFARGAWASDEIPLEVLMGAAVVVDVSEKCARDSDYMLSVGDLRDWEKRHGRIPDRAIVLLRTGWGDRWPDKKRYLGSDIPGDTSQLSFPGYSAGAAHYLVKLRKVKMVGIDTASIDRGRSTDFLAHRIFGAANVPGLENLAHLDRLPERGVELVALPMKIAGGSGGPCRIIARVSP